MSVFICQKVINQRYFLKYGMVQDSVTCLFGTQAKKHFFHKSARCVLAYEVFISLDPLKLITLKCSFCAYEFQFISDWMKGDPRNQAIIVHYDGWNPNNTSNRNSIASITITPACVLKHNRSLSQNSFVPCLRNIHTNMMHFSSH